MQTLAATLRDDAPVHPTHGFGSHCASVADEIMRDGTVADERTRNPALTRSEDQFVDQLLHGLHPYPAYYAHMGPQNASGPAPIDLSPPRSLDADALRQHLAAGDWGVDLCTRRAYAAGHLRGTVNVELRNDLPTYLGWGVPLGRRIRPARRERSGRGRSSTDADADRPRSPRRRRDRRTRRVDRGSTARPATEPRLRRRCSPTPDATSS